MTANLADRALAGHVRSAARLMRLVDDHPSKARPLLSQLYPHTGRAHVIGVTGSPGAGKSSLTARLISGYRSQNLRVGVVAVDPSSPFSGGAILGDRVRMMEHATDPGVFIRSVASRGALGGVSRSTEDVVHVLDAMGHDVVIVETVGVGQAEVDIVQLAQTVLVVMTPGYGDEVQAMKAGLLEIADIFVVNKADHKGANALARQLRMLWELKSHDAQEWQPPVLKTVAHEGKGTAPVLAAIGEHRAHDRGSDSGRRREQARAQRALFNLLRSDLMAALFDRVLDEARLTTIVSKLLDRSADPYTTAKELVDELLSVAALPENG